MNITQTVYPLLADIVVLLHLAFVVFVVLGGLMVKKWPRLIWLHLPAVLWGIVIEVRGGICPLTPLESWLRHKGGEDGRHSDFIAHYLLPMLYPEGLTRRSQLVLGALVVVVNVAIYGWIYKSRKRAR
jgi:hypothetical protein